MPGRSIAAILEDLLLNGISGSIDNSGAATLTEQQTQTTLLTRISNGAATRPETIVKIRHLPFFTWVLIWGHF